MVAHPELIPSGGIQRPIQTPMLAIALLTLATAAIGKVEPPGWWAPHSLGTVRVLLTSAGLRAGAITSSSPFLSGGMLSVDARGQHGLADLTIAPNAPPGRYTLRAGTAEFPFEVMSPLTRPGRFQGITSDDVIYLIMPDRFANGDPSNDGPQTDRREPRLYHGGDLRGIVQRLPYLKQLGVTTLWVTPVYDNSNRMWQTRHGPYASYHGYGAIDLYAVDEHLGTLEEFRRLVDAAHRAGLKVIQDQVANHVGEEHPWAVRPPSSNWLHGSAASHLALSSELWALLDPYRTPALVRRILQGWFVDRLPDLNQSEPDVERYLIQNTLWWTGISGIDGIRQDTVPYVPKSFWRKWNAAMRLEYPQLTAIGEVFSRDANIVAHFEDAGFRLFDFPLEQAIRRVFIDGAPMTALPESLMRDHLFEHPQGMVTFLGLHDLPRFRERGSADAMRDAFTFVLTTRGTPLIYYGDEIGMRGGEDPDNRRDFPGGWPQDSRSAFEAAGRTAEEAAIFDHVQRLLKLRASSPALRHGKLVNLHATSGAYVYARQSADEVVMIALGEPVRFEAQVPAFSAADALGSGNHAAGDGGTVTVRGPGIYRLTKNRR